MACVVRMDVSPLDERIEFGRKAVEQQVEYFTRQFGSVASDWKTDGSRVTEADLYLSKTFQKELLAAFSEDQFFSEELDHGDESIEVMPGYAWLLDPIDGTNNFARGIPTCSISLGLLKDGFPVYGYVYDYASGKLLHGGMGKGVFIGGSPIEKKRSKVDSNSLISMQCWRNKQAIEQENALQKLYKLRAFGSSEIHTAYAAVGWTDGVIAHRIKSWDIVAGVAMMKGAGGSTRFFDTKVFPMKTFSTQEVGFGHISGSEEMCDAIEKAIGRTCAYRV